LFPLPKKTPPEHIQRSFYNTFGGYTPKSAGKYIPTDTKSDSYSDPSCTGEALCGGMTGEDPRGEHKICSTGVNGDTVGDLSNGKSVTGGVGGDEDEDCSAGVGPVMSDDLRRSGDDEKGDIVGERSGWGSIFSIGMAGAKSVRTWLVSNVFDGEFGCIYYTT